MRCVGLVLSLSIVGVLWLAVPLARAQDGGRSVVTINGKTVEVLGPSSSISSSNGNVTIRSGGREVRIADGKLIVGKKQVALPDYQKLTLDLGKGKVLVDDQAMDELSDALQDAGKALDDAGKALDDAGKALDDAGKALEGMGSGDDADEAVSNTAGKTDESAFPKEQVKTVVLTGLRRAFKIESDAKAEQVTVRRLGLEKSIAGVTVAVKDGTLTVAGVMSAASQPRTTIVVPPSVSVKIEGCRKGSVGDLSGAVSLSTTGEDDVKLGKVGSADVKIMGSADVKIASVEGGDLRVELLGSGNVEIGGGTAKEGTLTVTGTGDVVCRAVIGKAKLHVTGTGTIKVVAPKQIVEKDVTGTGEIQILKD